MSILLVYALSVLSCLKFGCGSTAGSCLEIEKQALLLLKKSLTDEQGFNCLLSWVGDDCCAWYGIDCNNITGHVMQLDLRQCYLRGDQINPSLLDLKYLTHLDLSYNTFDNVQIPQFFGSFKDLTYLNLSRTEFTGLVPHHFGNLSNLRYLDLSVNFKIVNSDTGYLTEYLLSIDSLEWLPNLSLLVYLDLSLVDLSRAIPADWFVNLLTQAYSLDLSNNDIREVDLNPLSALTSAELNHLSSLQLSNTGLSGELPAFICNLQSLSVLVLSNNKFSGTIPQYLRNMIQMEDLDLMNNSLSGDIPDFLGSMRGLTYLNLHNNKFQGTLPLSFQNLSKLILLDVGKNNLSGILPPWIGEQLPRLRYLILRSNNFYGNISTQLCHHSLIQVINLSRNKFTGNIPPCFNNFSAMITSESSEYSFYHAIPVGETRMIIDDAEGYEQKYTSTLRFMFSIDLSNNNISGEIPEELMDLSGLLSLNLAGNNLAGRIPDRIGKLKKLEFLDLSRNKLYGLLEFKPF